MTKYRGRSSLILAGSFFFLLLSFLSNTAYGQDLDFEAWTEQPQNILIHIDLLDLYSINNVKQTFDANFYFELKWNDDSLSHAGPGSRMINLEEIWNPQIQILNQQQVQHTFTRQAEVFPDGKVVYRQRVFGAFSQPLELSSYPFDQQTIQLKLVAAGFSPANVKLTINDTSTIAQNLSIPDWSVLEWRVLSEEIGIGHKNVPMSMAVLSVDLKRHPRFFIVKVLLPLVLIVLMSWTVFWINPMNTGAQISVSVTAMLTLIAFQFSMTAMLPPLSLLTRLDWFVIYTTSLVFFSLLEVVYTTSLASSGQAEKALRTDRIARWVFPALFLLALVDSLYLTN